MRQAIQEINPDIIVMTGDMVSWEVKDIEELEKLINSLANLYVSGKLTLEQVKSQIEEKNYETLNRTIMQLNLKKSAGGPVIK